MPRPNEETQGILDEVQGREAWVEQNDVRLEQGMWTATSFSGGFSVTRATFKGAVHTAMVIQRMLKERGL